MYILLCNKWLIFKIKFIIRSFVHRMCLWCMYIRCGAFDIDGCIFRSQHFRRKQRNFVKLWTKAEANEWGTQKMREAHARTNTHTYTQRNQMDRSIYAWMCLAYFPRFRQSVHHGWRLQSASCSMRSQKNRLLCAVYRLREMCFGGWNFIDFSFFRASPLCSRSVLSYSHSHTHAHSLTHLFLLCFIVVCVYISKWSQFLAAFFPMCLQSYRIIYPYWAQSIA